MRFFSDEISNAIDDMKSGTNVKASVVGSVHDGPNKSGVERVGEVGMRCVAEHAALDRDRFGDGGQRGIAVLGELLRVREVLQSRGQRQGIRPLRAPRCSDI